MKRSYPLYFLTFFLIPALLMFPQTQVTKLVKIQKSQLSINNPWPVWCEKAMKATADAVSIWSLQVKIINGRIDGPSASAPPGCMTSPLLKNSIRNFMILRKVPKLIAVKFAEAISGQWSKWQSKVTIPGLPLYPAFAAFPGPVAPPTRGIPFPLSAFVSSGQIQLSGTKMKNALQASIGSEADSPGVKRSLEKFSSEFAVRFLGWISKVKVVNLLGMGPVPTFAPPFHPSGPVMNGTILPRPGILSVAKF